METNLINASLILLVGMSTVFFILFIVVSGGNLLIRLVNKIEVETHELPFSRLKSDNIESSKITIIHKAVKTLTDGRGRIEKIDRK